MPATMEPPNDSLCASTSVVRTRDCSTQHHQRVAGDRQTAQLRAAHRSARPPLSGSRRPRSRARRTSRGRGASSKAGRRTSVRRSRRPTTRSRSGSAFPPVTSDLALRPKPPSASAPSGSRRRGAVDERVSTSEESDIPVTTKPWRSSIAFKVPYIARRAWMIRGTNTCPGGIDPRFAPSAVCRACVPISNSTACFEVFVTFACTPNGPDDFTETETSFFRSPVREGYAATIASAAPFAASNTMLVASSVNVAGNARNCAFNSSNPVHTKPLAIYSTTSTHTSTSWTCRSSGSETPVTENCRPWCNNRA